MFVVVAYASDRIEKVATEKSAAGAWVGLPGAFWLWGWGRGCRKGCCEEEKG